MILRKSPYGFSLSFHLLVSVVAGEHFGTGVNHSFQVVLSLFRVLGRTSWCWQLSGLAEVLWALLLPPSALTAFYSNSHGCPKYSNLAKQEEAFGYLGALTYSSATPRLLQHSNESGGSIWQMEFGPEYPVLSASSCA